MVYILWIFCVTFVTLICSKTCVEKVQCFNVVAAVDLFEWRQL